MRHTTSALLDKTLRFTQSLPWPANRITFAVVRRFIGVLGRTTGWSRPVRFGSVEITAPLEHPVVYWRYYPPEFNQNYVLVAQRILQMRRGLIIDVGANIGDGVALLRGAGVDAPILAVEGAPVWFELLRSNTREMRDVAVENVLLGAGEQKYGLVLEVKRGTSKLVQGDAAVEIVSLDDLLAGYKKDPVVMLKTDTDGFDVKVLLGARKLLEQQHPVIFAEVDEVLLRGQGNSSEELLQYLAECGYSDMTIWDNRSSLLTSRPIAQGIADLIASYPGYPVAYFDIAFYAEADRDFLK